MLANHGNGDLDLSLTVGESLSNDLSSIPGRIFYLPLKH